MFIYFLFMFPEIGIFESGLPFQFSLSHVTVSLLPLCNTNVYKHITGIF